MTSHFKLLLDELEQQDACHRRMNLSVTFALSSIHLNLSLLVWLTDNLHNEGRRERVRHDENKWVSERFDWQKSRSRWGREEEWSLWTSFNFSLLKISLFVSHNFLSSYLHNTLFFFRSLSPSPSSRSLNLSFTLTVYPSKRWLTDSSRLFRYKRELKIDFIFQGAEGEKEKGEGWCEFG